MPLELIELLSRLLHHKYRNASRIKYAHYVLRQYAEAEGLEENWCDAVMLMYLDDWQ